MMAFGKPNNPPKRNTVFGVTDSLIDSVRDMYKSPAEKETEEDSTLSSNDASTTVLAEAGKGRADVAATSRNVARKSGALRSKDSVSSGSTTRFKQRHAGKTVPTRPGTEGQPHATGMGSASRGGSKRPLGGASAVQTDLASVPEDEFRRKYGKSKSAMRTSLRDHTEYSQYQYNRNSWSDALSKVGTDGIQEETVSEMRVVVMRNPGGTSVKVISVSKDMDGRIRPGETLTDTHLDDLRDSDVSISYTKDRKLSARRFDTDTAKNESVDVDAKNVDKALKHDCASHVQHEQWGEGQCIPGQHTLVEGEEKIECDKCDGDGEVDSKECEHCEGKGFHMEGFVTHYDVMFENGIQENVPVEDLKIISEKHHGHSMKKKMSEADNDEEEDEDDTVKSKKKKKLDKVDKDELEGSHDDREDGDIDNDGDEDDSDKFLHKKRKAISKNIKEWINFAQKKPGDGKVKNAMEANLLAQHFLQMAQRDKLFGRDASENDKLSKQFYEQYKEMKKSGDESDDNTFQNEKVVDALDSSDISEARGADFSQLIKKRGKERMQKTSIGTDHKIAPQYDTKTHKLIKKKGIPGLKTVPKDYEIKDDEYEAESVEPQKDSTNLGEHAPEVVEYIPSQYSYNKQSWSDALQEVNRYKGRSGHRVTKPDKDGPEHIIMQLRKVESMGDKHAGVDFQDGTKVKVKPDTAKRALERYARMKPDEKEKWQKTAAHSHSGLSHASSDKKIDHTSPGQSKPQPARKPSYALDHDQHPADS